MKNLSNLGESILFETINELTPSKEYIEPYNTRSIFRKNRTLISQESIIDIGNHHQYSITIGYVYDLSYNREYIHLSPTDFSLKPVKKGKIRHPKGWSVEIQNIGSVLLIHVKFNNENIIILRNYFEDSILTKVYFIDSL